MSNMTYANTLQSMAGNTVTILMDCNPRFLLAIPRNGHVTVVPADAPPTPDDHAPMHVLFARVGSAVHLGDGEAAALFTEVA